MNILKKYVNEIMGEQLDFRVRLFNIMAIGGATMSFFTVIQSLITQRWGVAAITLVMMLISIGLLIYALKSGKYQKCYYITIILIFLIFFPFLFFSSGGYKGGVPSVFIFAVLFTVLMLEGIGALIISTIELAVYAGICIVAYLYPDLVNSYTTEREIVMDILFSYTAIGLICGIVLFLHIKEYSRQRELLKKKNEQLKHYDEVKSTFLTTVAHEVKNPLNIIGLYAQDTYELTDENPIDLKQIQENQKTIQNTVIRLDRILVDLMDTVSIEQGRIKLSIAPMDTKILIKEAVQFWTEKEGKELDNGNRFVVDIKADTSPIMADYARIFQVLINLLSNASRHTKNGLITITLDKVEGAQLVTVKDTGEGMKEEVKDHAFCGYVSTSKDYWRHGIGLYICHQIIVAHGGDIQIKSKEGVGTEISFTLPETLDDNNVAPN